MMIAIYLFIFYLKLYCFAAKYSSKQHLLLGLVFGFTGYVCEYEQGKNITNHRAFVNR